ncbi:MAG: glycosyltransferase [Erythrobacter sp.]
MAKNVLVFRQTYLPVSETFIAEHIKNLRSWAPFPICETRVDNNHTDLKESTALISTSKHIGRIERYLLRNRGINRSLSKLVKRVRPSLIHAHFLTDASIVMRFATRHEIPLVATAHGYDASTWDNDLSLTPGGNWFVGRESSNRN